MSGSNILDILSHPAAADPSVYTKGIEGLNALRDQQAKQASADAYRQATDPATGQVDVPTYNRLISQGPGAWNAGELMRQQGVAQAAQGQGVQEQLTAHRSRMAFMLGQMNDLLAKGQPIRAGDIATALNNAHYSPSEAAQITQMVNGASGGDPNFDYTGFVKNQVTANLDAKAQIDRVTPKIEFQQTPQGLVAVDTNPNTTKTPPGSALPYGLGPGTKYWDPKGGPDGTGAWVLSGGIVAPGTVTPPGQGGGGGGGGAPALNAAGDSATRKAAEGGPPAPNTPAAAVAQRTHDFWIRQGYSEPQVAGILAGGPGSESDFIPTASGDGGTSIGLYQHHGTRLHNAQGTGLFDRYGPNPTADQQNEYAAWEISPEGPLASVGAALKAAKTPAEAATIFTRDFGVPKDKSEIARRANGAQRFVGLYGGQPQGAPPAASTAPPATPAGPPGVQMGGAPPPPPGGAPGPYTGGGIGAALAPGGATNPVVVRGTPIPAGRLSGNVGAMVQGMQLAQANPLQMGARAMVAGPGAPTGNALAGSSVEPPPQPGWGSAVGTYSGGPGGAAPVARPAVPAPAPVAAPVRPPATPPSGQLMAEPPLGTVETLTNDIKARTEASVARGDQQKTLEAGESALEALRLAKGYTGPGTGTTSQMYAFLQAHDPTGALPQGNMTDTAWRQVLAKNLLRFAQNSGLRGNTDLGLTKQLEGTANVDEMLPTANEHVLIDDIGRARQRMAQTVLMPASSIHGDVVNHLRNYTGDTDFRGFSIDLMSQPQRDAIEKELKRPGNEKALARFTRAVHDGMATGLIKPPSGQP